MKKFLPKFVLITFFSIAFLLVGTLTSVSAQTLDSPNDVNNGNWVEDPEVTFVGKAANRANDFLNWTLQNYNWLCVEKAGDACVNTYDNNPLVEFWEMVRNIIYALLLLFVLGTAGVIIVTRGQNITIMRFVPRFIVIILLVTFSFALVQFLYVVVDIVQGFFLRPDGPEGPLISSADLLYIAFPYEFTGFRALGSDNDESAFISLLLVKLTAITYYVMTGVLLVRKIILWFFLIVSPIFPLLIFYRPVRNTAKIWVGEFFRWLLYAPLFALFLHGLVVMWRDKIPLAFDFNSQGSVAGTDVLYPTAVNILIGGPGQQIGINNSVNLPDTFALYVVALIMLWVVILLPFLLLRIFLDYFNSISFSGFMSKQVNKNFAFLNPRGPSGGPTPPPPPGKVFPTGMARQLPFLNKAAKTIEVGRPVSTSSTRDIRSSVQSNVSQPVAVREVNEVLKSVNISVPKMQDVVKYERALLSNNITERQTVTQFRETLEKIANPAQVTSVTERQQFSQIHEKLTTQQERGNPLATSILKAAGKTTVSSTIDINQQLRMLLQQLASPSTVNPRVRQKMSTLKTQLTGAQHSGNNLATTVLTTAEKISKKELTKEQEDAAIEEIKTKIQEQKQTSDPVTQSVVSTMQQAQAVTETQSLPVINRVQQVSIEDYEEVRKMWVENYETLEPPKTLEGKQLEREEWVRSDVQKINEAVTLLSSVEPQKVNEGMEMVGSILPFLLMGGFSKSEVVAYLKAKLAAAKSILEAAEKQKDDEDSMIYRETKKEEAKEMSIKHAIELPSEKESPKNSEDDETKTQP